MITLTQRSTRARYARRGWDRMRAAHVLNVVYETPDERFFTTTEVVPGSRAHVEEMRRAALEHSLAHPAARPVDAYLTPEPVGRFRRGEWRTREEAAAIREFGTTEDLLQAGYILPDGTMLDFRRRMGGRFIVHNEIGKVLQPDQAAWRGGAIRAALDRGWVRVLSYGARPSSFGVEASRPMTPAQQRQIRDAAELYGVDDVHIEVFPTAALPLHGEVVPPGTYSGWDRLATPPQLPAALREANQQALSQNDYAVARAAGR